MRTADSSERDRRWLYSHKRFEMVLTNDELRTSMEVNTPLRRLGEPLDIALGVLYLCSSAGSYITGKILEIDGGLNQPNLLLGLPDL